MMNIERQKALNLLPSSDRDRYSLLSAIKRCDALVAETREIQVQHSENLCRVANRLAAGETSLI